MIFSGQKRWTFLDKMKITALAGGVGGAKLAQGLAKVLNFEDLAIIVNTGDDFEYLGLHISPDVDTVSYTMAGLANEATGWGLQNDTFNSLEKISELKGPDWFKLGDKDLATHLIRTHRLREGDSLTRITFDLCGSWGIEHKILPMTDDPVRTMVDTVEGGMMPFQEYFVKNHFLPQVKGFYFQGIDSAIPTIEVLQAIASSDAVVICPSNPFVSIDPILSLKGLRSMLREKYVLAVSPIVGSKAIKGPLAKMFKELNIEPSVKAIIDHYGDLLNCLFIDNLDRDQISAENHSSIILNVSDIIIPDVESRTRLASEIVTFLKKNIKENK
jgi:LPPG:FO 2-phospho-L-lactate transferase